MPIPQEIFKLVERFEAQSKAYQSGNYNEAQIRAEFIDPLFKALGWDKASKYVCEKHSGPGAADPGREQIILDMIAAKGQVTRQMVADELNVSRATTGRLLVGLETKGLIVRKGGGQGIYYILAASAPAP